MCFLSRVNQALRPNSPYDTPFLSFNLRAGHKFMSEYDTDFSRATVDGVLSKDFSPEVALKQIQCPMLMMRAKANRHEIWGLIGAIDDHDLVRIIELVDDLKYVQVAAWHEIHMLEPQRYIDEVTSFVGKLRDEGKLSK